MTKLPKITVHGRFQPPLHVNHWEYVRRGFELAEHVTILITNPDRDEIFEKLASWRSDIANNPFSYDERVRMFADFFAAMKIEAKRYSFVPFNIQDASAFASLESTTPNLVNVYSEWSNKKVSLFEDKGLKVIKLYQPKIMPVSGTIIRNIIANVKETEGLAHQLIGAGFMPEAVPGLVSVIAAREEKM